ncbi:MAG: phosphopentomutase [Oscillospiraceae bacterium]|nr:phosphopentomutase [Oscillospiraceae bacterium]
MKTKRVFLIVLDSFGIGGAPDAEKYSDLGSNTLAALAQRDWFCPKNLAKLGLFNIDTVDCRAKESAPAGAFGRMIEVSAGKDTTIGHWELAGIVSERPLPTYPDGFPQELIEEYERRIGRGVLCNKPYSGTEVIHDYGREQIESGKMIVYTSADSVFQIAAHEKYIGLEELYRCCKIAREMLVGEHGVGRVIARPYVGEYPEYTRTSNRHDYSLVPPAETMLDVLQQAGKDVISVGKIVDIFAGKGITESNPIKGNADGMAKTVLMAERDFNGLCFINLVDFDSVYGHRNDVDGYAKAIMEFDGWLESFLPKLKEDDLLIITADHGCDPSTESTDHSRESVPLLLYGNGVEAGKNLGTLNGFFNVANIVKEALL